MRSFLKRHAKTIKLCNDWSMALFYVVWRGLYSAFLTSHLLRCTTIVRYFIESIDQTWYVWLKMDKSVIAPLGRSPHPSNYQPAEKKT